MLGGTLQNDSHRGNNNTKKTERTKERTKREKSINKTANNDTEKEDNRL